jgi:hypothetical protein
MANTSFFKSKPFKVIRMTTIGAMLPIPIMWLSGVGYNIFGHDQGEAGFRLGLGFLFCIPSSIIANIFGLTNASLDRGLPNPYMVNSLLAAGICASGKIPR